MMDNTYQTKVYIKQGGAELVVDLHDLVHRPAAASAAFGRVDQIHRYGGQPADSAS